MSHILLIGKNGQLGWELQRTLATVGEITAVDYPDIDLGHPETAGDLIRKIRPVMIVNAAAYTAVDKAESEPELAKAINGTGPGVLAEEARKLRAVLIHYSTDYVFDGKKGALYEEADLPNPLNVYGISKLQGERAIQQVGGDYLILRTSWVYTLRTSAGSLRQGGFVNQVLEWARQQEILHIVADQVGNPTWCRMLAEMTAQVLTQADNYIRERTGLYHLAGSGFASRFDWAKLILELDPNKSEQRVKEIIPDLTANFPSLARRPLFSALNYNKFIRTFNLRLPEWENALQLAMDMFAHSTAATRNRSFFG
jgi:dTDP-4-dehydrorhamnose reductase